MTIKENKNFTTSGDAVDYDPFAVGDAVDYDPFAVGDAVDYDPFAGPELEAVVPATYMQMEIWLSAQMGDEASCAFNETCTMRFIGSLDRSALHGAIQDVVQRHQSLRATFSADGEKMCIAKTIVIDLPETKLPDNIDFDNALAKAIAKEVSIPFNLGHGPLFRAHLLQRNKDEHYLFLAAHHIICDGWSLEVIIDDLGKFYSSRVNKQTCLLKRAPQYGEYAIASRTEIIHDEQRKARKYWLDVLSGELPTLELPLDKTRPEFRSYSSARVDYTLPPQLVDKLKHFGADHRTSFFTVLFTGFQILLHRLTGQTDIITGVAHAGRLQAGLTNLVGHCVNLLPIRSSIRGPETFLKHLEQIHCHMLDAHDHYECSFGSLVADLKINRQVNRIPLISVTFGYSKLVINNTQKFQNLQSQFSVNPRTYENFDLFVSTVEDQGKVTFQTQYNTDLFDGETIARWLKCFEMLLEAAIGQADKPIAELPLMDALSIRQLIYDWNNTQKPYPKDICLHQLFEEQVIKTPENVAVVFEGETLSYKELNAKANQVAHYLRKQGVGPDVLVGVLMERCFEMIIGLLGILKAGGAYVPIDSSYPKDRILFILKDSQVPVLLIQHRLMESLPNYKGHIVCLDTDWAGVAQESQENPRNRNNMGDLSYVIYTSGSTGKPKGVMVAHRAICNHMNWMTETFSMNSKDRVLQKTSFSFDASVWEFYAPLLAGGQLVVARPGGHQDGEYLIETIIKEQVTTLQLVPSLLKMLLEGEGLEKCSCLKRVFCGGEVLTAELQERFFDRLNTNLYNLYGPTEAAIDTLYWACKRGNDLHTVPVGRPIANAQIYVLDPRLQPVPIGIPGELHIGGAGVARGYLNQPELTAERFLRDPFAPASEPGARLYKTGDLGRWLPDGTIEFLGRNDFQVKIRGFRIELGEIEARLAAIAGVGETAVLAREDSPGNQRLVAYYTVKDKDVSRELTAETLRHHLSSQLPEYMLPSAYMAIERFPLTPNGKTDRNALPAPEAGAYITRAYEAPVGEPEETLSQIWSELLDVEKVGRRDHFFDLGGHSLLAVKMIERLRRKGLNIDVRSLFMTPTLMDFATAIGKVKAPVQVPPNLIFPSCDRISPEMLTLIALEQRDIDHIVESTPGGASNIQDIYPLAPLQEGILFHHLLDNQSDVYLLFSLLSFESRELLDSFLSALQAVINRHDILRTAIVWEELPEPVQVVWRKAPLAVEQITIDPLAGDAVGQLRSRFNRGNFRIDIHKAPMIRAFIARDDIDDRWLVALPHHHLVSDHTTLEILNEEIRAHLADEASLLPSALPFRNFVAQSRLGVSRGEHEAFFRRMLNDVVEPTAPFDLLNVLGDGSDIAEAQLPMDMSLSHRLRERARVLGVSAASMFHLAWARVLACLSGRDDVVFGTVLFGRMQGGLGADRVMGMFINTLPVRIDVKNETVDQVVQKTHRLLAELLYHEHASLALAQHCSGVQSPLPLFTSLLNYRYYGRTSPSEDPNTAWGGMKTLHEEERTNYPIMLSVNDLGEGFSLSAQTHKSIEPIRICEFMNTVIRNMINALEKTPHTTIEFIEVLPQVERQQVLFDWNATETDYPKDRCVHQLFEVQVEKTPDAVAVIYEDKQLSYAQLNRRANRLAHYLRMHGVGPEKRVGICTERSLEMIVGLLGILKAGGAYVPLDPSYPKERLSFILKDTQASVLLTQEKLKDLAFDHNARVIFLDSDWRSISLESENNIKNRSNPGNPAYVIYTSGSTGVPKGVMIPHRALTNHMLWMQRVYPLNSSDAVLQKTPFSFDASIWEFYAPLIAGAKLIIAKPELHADPAYIVNTTIENNVTILQFVPSILQLMLDEPHFVNCKSLRRLFCGGESLSSQLQNRFIEQLPWATLHNLYGPTEATIDALAWNCSHKKETGTIPIGWPIDNVRVYVVDKLLQPVPIGVKGELLIGGDCLSLGYLNRPELNSARFIPDPFSNREGATLYKTGDLVRYLPDGSIEFLGRQDHQVKIRGLRIELGEIESVLSTHEAIRQAVVVSNEETPGDVRLIAFYIPENNQQLTVTELRKYLRTKLPDYMIPQQFVELYEIPLTDNGKINRKALLVQAAPAGTSSDEFVAPSTDAEIYLAAIWAEVLRVPRVSSLDNFIEIGGHSLLVMRVIARVEKETGYRYNLRAMIQDTLMQLAVHLPINSAEEQPDENSGTADIIPEAEKAPAEPLFKRLFAKF